MKFSLCTPEDWRAFYNAAFLNSTTIKRVQGLVLSPILGSSASFFVSYLISFFNEKRQFISTASSKKMVLTATNIKHQAQFQFNDWEFVNCKGWSVICQAHYLVIKTLLIIFIKNYSKTLNIYSQKVTSIVRPIIFSLFIGSFCARSNALRVWKKINCPVFQGLLQSSWGCQSPLVANFSKFVKIPTNQPWARSPKGVARVGRYSRGQQPRRKSS